MLPLNYDFWPCCEAYKVNKRKVVLGTSILQRRTLAFPLRSEISENGKECVREWARLRGPNRLVDFDKGTSSAHLERIQNGISFNNKIFPSWLQRRCVMCDSIYFVNTNVSSHRQTSETCAFEKINMGIWKPKNSKTGYTTFVSPREDLYSVGV